MGIVGHKIEQWFEITVSYDRKYYRVVTHRRVMELHATKGWRGERHTQAVQHVRNLPSIREQRKAQFSVFQRLRSLGTPAPKWSRPDFPIKPEALMRHRERRRDIRIAENIAAAKKEDQRLAGLR